ncbi:uncharacterized protein [Littorina saxatilis]|uniref:uncharacterized protein n=1 Tax=Littorina saxatilis TaxID=31220 RepID=UPI0038B64633
MDHNPTPTHILTVPPGTDNDTAEPWVRTAILDSESNRVFLTDATNTSVKVIPLASPYDISEVNLDTMPWGLALVPTQGEKLLAVTSMDYNVIHMIDVTADPTPTVVQRIYTGRRYIGVDAFDDSRMVVSCCRDGRSDQPPSVDFFTLGGNVEGQAVTSQLLTELRDPRYLCVHGVHVYISDFENHCVYKADLSTGQLIDKLTHPQLQSPCQVCTDHTGNLYVTSKEGRVLVRTRSGQWRSVLEGRQHGEGVRTRPRCVVSVPDTELLVSWDKDVGGDSVLKGYHLGSSALRHFLST